MPKRPTHDYLLRNIPADVWERARDRAWRDKTTVRQELLLALLRFAEPEYGEALRGDGAGLVVKE